MADFARVTLPDGTEVLFEEPGADLVTSRGRHAAIKGVEPDAARLETIAQAARQVSEELRTRLIPDELTLEIGVGLTGEVGWFFAKATSQGSLKVTLTWKKTDPASPNNKPLAS